MLNQPMMKKLLAMRLQGMVEANAPDGASDKPKLGLIFFLAFAPGFS
jgi:hypothetical protein